MRSFRAPVVSTLLALVLVASLTSTAGVGMAATATPTPSSNPCVGTVTDEPDSRTLVSIQGAQLTEDAYLKRPALLASFASDGEFVWTRNASAQGRWWAYDVDPLPNGNLLFVTTEDRATLVGELDPTENEYVWLERFDGAPNDTENPLVTDAHDVDKAGDELVIADKGEGHERLLVYNRTRDEVAWEWRFENHTDRFPKRGGGPEGDWTHLNDVDRVNVSQSDAVDAEGEWFMASVRNFDTVAFVNRSSKEVEVTLGGDGNHDVLRRQHNPDHMWGPNGEHTVLVADSLNDRVVEYEYDGSEWERVWSVTGFDEPRDADRLPNGNTLITDRMGHRVVEVTPTGEIVWEVYTPYEPYDAERGAPSSNGPTMREHGIEGRYVATGAAEFAEEDVEACSDALFSFAPSKLDVVAADAVDRDVHRGESVPVVPFAVGGAVALLVAGAAVYRYRG
jgi:hypothetical protein